MKKYFSVGEAAKILHITSETLRHYDRIGLIKPSKKDEWTNYRYYTGQDIVRINTVRALQQMDLPLQKIKEVLEYQDFEKIIAFLSEAEKKADKKLAAIHYSKSKIQLAKSDYEKKLSGQQSTKGIFITYFPERTLLLSETLQSPSLDNLWNYLSHFYEQINPSQKEQFAFEDVAGVYTENGLSRLFALCIRYENIEGLKILPAGNYLCVDCSENERKSKLNELQQRAITEYQAQHEFIIEQIVLSGILQWNYQLQVYVGE